MKNKFISLLLCGIFILCHWGCTQTEEEIPSPPAPADTWFSGVWVTSVASTVMDSRDNIRTCVETCSSYGINHIFIVVWNKGYTHYPSAIMKQLTGEEIAPKYTGRDPLQEMIEEAHKKNIQVHAWFEYGFAASYNANGGAILQRNPHWAARDREGKLLTKNGFEWMNPFHPEVRECMLSLVMEVVEKYDIDGIQGDDRMPALPATGGYDDYTVQLYQQAHNGANPPASHTDEAWINWCAGLLTEFQGELYRRVKAAKPDVVVSCAPSVYPWGRTEYLQDWPAWVSKGYTDLVIPQHYRYDADAYQATLLQQLQYLPSEGRNRFYPGLLIRNGAYTPEPAFLQQMIEINRRNGIRGEVFWFYEGLSLFPDFFTTYRNH